MGGFRLLTLSPPPFNQIADKLNLKGLEGLSKNELMNTVQQYLDENEAKLSKTELFKGLYTKRKRT